MRRRLLLLLIFMTSHGASRTESGRRTRRAADAEDGVMGGQCQTRQQLNGISVSASISITELDASPRRPTR